MQLGWTINAENVEAPIQEAGSECDYRHGPRHENYVLRCMRRLADECLVLVHSMIEPRL